MKKILLSLTAVLALGASCANASSDSFTNDAVGVKVGTLGVGVEYVTNITKNLDLKIGVNGLNYTTDSDAEAGSADIAYTADVKLLSAAIGVDYHPFDNGFTVGAAVMYNGNEAEFGGTADGSVEIGGTVYSANDIGQINGDVTFNDFAPYVGIGYSNMTRSEGFHFTADLGLMYQGSAKLNYTIECSDSLAPAECAQLQLDVANEASDIEDELAKYKVYPVASSGVGYKF